MVHTLFISIHLIIVVDTSKWPRQIPSLQQFSKEFLKQVKESRWKKSNANSWALQQNVWSEREIEPMLYFVIDEYNGLLCYGSLSTSVFIAHEQNTHTHITENISVSFDRPSISVRFFLYKTDNIEK